MLCPNTLYFMATGSPDVCLNDTIKLVNAFLVFKLLLNMATLPFARNKHIVIVIGQTAF